MRTGLGFGVGISGCPLSAAMISRMFSRQVSSYGRSSDNAERLWRVLGLKSPFVHRGKRSRGAASCDVRPRNFESLDCVPIITSPAYCGNHRCCGRWRWYASMATAANQCRPRKSTSIKSSSLPRIFRERLPFLAARVVDDFGLAIDTNDHKRQCLLRRRGDGRRRPSVVGDVSAHDNLEPGRLANRRTSLTSSCIVSWQP